MRGKAHLIAGSATTLQLAMILGYSLNPINIATALFFSVAADLDEPNSNVMNKVVGKKMTSSIHNIIILSVCAISFFLFYKITKILSISIVASVCIAVILGKKFTSGKLRSILIFLFFLFTAILVIVLNIGKSGGITLLIVSLFPILRHRSFTHSLFMPFIMGFSLYFVERYLRINGLVFMSTTSYMTHLFMDIITKRGIPLFYPINKKFYHLAKFRVGSFVCNVLEWIFIILSLSTLFLTIILKTSI